MTAPEDANWEEGKAVDNTKKVISDTAEQSNQLGRGCMQTFCCCFPCFQFEEQQAQDEKNHAKIRNKFEDKK